MDAGTRVAAMLILQSVEWWFHKPTATKPGRRRLGRGWTSEARESVRIDTPANFGCPCCGCPAVSETLDTGEHVCQSCWWPWRRSDPSPPELAAGVQHIATLAEDVGRAVALAALTALRHLNISTDAPQPFASECLCRPCSTGRLAAVCAEHDMTNQAGRRYGGARN